MIKMLTISLVLFTSGLAYARASETLDFCPGDDLPYTFTVFEDILLINHSNRRAFCQHVEGSSFECLEKWPADKTVSVYPVEAVAQPDGTLLFKAGEDSDPIVASRCD